MFTQAGFRRDYKIIGRARVAIPGSFLVDGVLMRWPNGETAWGSRTRIVWPDQVIIAGEDRAELERLVALAGGGMISRFTPSGKVLA